MRFVLVPAWFYFIRLVSVDSCWCIERETKLVCTHWEHNLLLMSSRQESQCSLFLQRIPGGKSFLKRRKSCLFSKIQLLLSKDSVATSSQEFNIHIKSMSWLVWVYPSFRLIKRDPVTCKVSISEERCSVQSCSVLYCTVLNKILLPYAKVLPRDIRNMCYI